jgi:formylglycine-generating enzyme required for sulfatase activity
MKFLKVGAVVFGALIITTLGISAADTFSGNSGSLLGQLSGTQEGACPAGMTEVVVGKTFSCVDTYEVSAAETCPNTSPKTIQDTQFNINDLACITESKADGKPWTYVSRSQAQALCARSGKRLPSSDEWYTFSVGTLDGNKQCNTDSSGAAASGAYGICVSAAGVYDAVGNVWEWTTDDVFDGTYNNRPLPQEGYVTQVDAAGVATLTSSSPSQEFEKDYLWQNPEGIYGVLRGGFFGSGEDAGVYAVHARTAPTAATIAIGFRCVL